MEMHRRRAPIFRLSKITCAPTCRHWKIALIQALTRSKVEILEKTQGFIRERQTELLRASEKAAVFDDVEGFLTLRNASIDSPPWEI